jgi:hypothetical protein
LLIIKKPFIIFLKQQPVYHRNTLANPRITKPHQKNQFIAGKTIQTEIPILTLARGCYGKSVFDHWHHRYLNLYIWMGFQEVAASNSRAEWMDINTQWFYLWQVVSIFFRNRNLASEMDGSYHSGQHRNSIFSTTHKSKNRKLRVPALRHALDLLE